MKINKEDVMTVVNLHIHTIRNYPKAYKPQLLLNALALGNEAGEFQGEVKKLVWYENVGPISAEQKERCKVELTDTYYHLVALCDLLGMTLDDLDHRLYNRIKMSAENNPTNL